MTASTLIVDYLGQGLAAARPVTPNVPATGIAIYCSTDTGDTDVYFAGSWTTISSGGSGITQLTGDVTAGPGSGSQATTIANNAVTTAKINDAAVTNAKLDNMPGFTFKMNSGPSSAAPQDADYPTVAAALAAFFPGSSFVATSTQTTNFIISSADAGFRFDNDGAAGDIVGTLPPASDGLVFGFVVFASHYLKIQTDGSDIISFGSKNSSSGGFIRSNTPFSYIIIEAHGVGQWVASTVLGVWDIDGGTSLTTAFISGAVTNGHAAIFNAAGEVVDGGAAPGSGTVTSVSFTGPGGIFSVSGSPITSSGTIDETVAGTSGGIPYFSNGTTLDSSGALTANEPVIGGGAGATPTVGSRKGNTTIFATSTAGAVNNNHVAAFDSNGNIVDAGYTKSNLATALAQWVSGATVADGDFYFAYKMPFAGTIDSLDYFTASGSFTVAVKINGTNVTGLSAVSVSSSIPSNATATAANVFVIGDAVSGTISSAAGSPTDSVLNLNMTRS